MTFEFTIDEVNVIMQALSLAPYGQVFQVVSKIQQQAQPQLSADQNPVPTQASRGAGAVNA